MPRIFSKLSKAARSLYGVQSSHAQLANRLYDRYQPAIEDAAQRLLLLIRSEVLVGLDSLAEHGELAPPAATSLPEDDGTLSPLGRRLLELIRTAQIAKNSRHVGPRWQMSDSDGCSCHDGQDVAHGGESDTSDNIAKAADDYTKYLIDWRALMLKGGKVISDAILRAYAGAMADKGHATVGLNWDVVNERAVEWAALHSSELITKITNDTKLQIQDLISHSIEDGSTVQQAAKDIRPLMGLNGPQQAAAENYMAELEELADPDIDAKMEKYTAKAIRYRADMIARTETITSVAAGTLANYEEMGEDQYVFETAADCCEKCAEIDNETYDIADAEVGVNMPPIHPNCRCAVVSIPRAEEEAPPEEVDIGEDTEVKKNLVESIALAKFDEDQPRDEHGRWLGAGAGWVSPPPPTGKSKAAAPGGYSASGDTVTKVGDRGEHLLINQCGMKSLIPPGHRQWPMDVGRGKLAYEVKTMTTSAKLYKICMGKDEIKSKMDYCKTNGLKPGMIIVVLDKKAGSAWAYSRAGIGSWTLNPATWTYMGMMTLTKGQRK